jgi:hypothetical protein
MRILRDTVSGFLTLAAWLGCSPAMAATVTLYDAANNTTPDNQGWAYIPLPGTTQSIAGGALNFSTAGSSATQAGYARLDQALDTVAGFDLSLIQLTVLSEAHSTTDRAGFSLIAIGSNPTQSLELAFWANEVWAYGFTGSAFVHGTGLTLTTTDPHDYTVRVRNNQWSLLVDGAATALGGPLVDYTPALFLIVPYEIPNFLFFGDDTSSAAVSISLKAVTLSAVPLPATAWLLALGLLGLLQRARRKSLG